MHTAPITIKEIADLLPLTALQCGESSAAAAARCCKGGLLFFLCLEHDSRDDGLGHSYKAEIQIQYIPSIKDVDYSTPGPRLPVLVFSGGTNAYFRRPVAWLP
jgi:hypothetical protein